MTNSLSYTSFDYWYFYDGTSLDSCISYNCVTGDGE
jgi:hypothetical protein